MEKKVITFKELDALIDQHKENAPQKGALLILKGQCKPLRDTGIPKRIAVMAVTNNKSTQELLAKAYAESENDDMFFFHDELAKGLGNVIHLCYPEEDDDD